MIHEAVLLYTNVLAIYQLVFATHWQCLTL